MDPFASATWRDRMGGSTTRQVTTEIAPMTRQSQEDARISARAQRLHWMEPMPSQTQATAIIR